MNSISILDYFKMAKSRGLKLPIKYFLENHLFDIINRTDTHRWLPKENYKENLNNIEHGVLYMSSWTSILKKSTLIAMQILENLNTCYDVLDVGSGKGKALLVWSKLKFPKDTLIYGIEYNKDLAKISKENIKKVGHNNEIKVLINDITQVETIIFKKTLLIYLYNPFDELIMKEFLIRFRSKKIILIYNNPVHSKLFEDFGYACIHSEKKWHPNANFNIYKSTNF